jgi:Ca2+-binding EF-hand superfamily protein
MHFPFEKFNIFDAIELLYALYGEAPCNMMQFKNYLNELMKTMRGEAPPKDSPINIGKVSQILFHSIDQDHNNILDPSELIPALSFLCGGTDRQKLRAIFSLFDDSQCGSLNFAELVSLFRSVSFFLKQQPAQQVVRSSPEKSAPAGKSSAIRKEDEALCLAVKCYHDNKLAIRANITFHTFFEWFKYS